MQGFQSPQALRTEERGCKPRKVAASRNWDGPRFITRKKRGPPITTRK